MSPTPTLKGPAASPPSSGVQPLQGAEADGTGNGSVQEADAETRHDEDDARRARERSPPQEQREDSRPGQQEGDQDPAGQRGERPGGKGVR